MTQVVLENFHLGGLSDSKYSGVANSSYKLQGLNIHEEPGVVKVQQSVALDRASGATLSNDVVNIIHTAKGLNGYADSSETYLFQDDGKTYSRSNSSVYALDFTATGNTCRDALAFNGWMFYTTSTEIGFFAAGDSGVRQNSISDLQGIASLSDKLFHPLGIVENKLYIGDGGSIHEVSVSTKQGAGQISSTSGASITGTSTDFNPDLKEGYVVRAENGAGVVEERTIVSNAGSDTSANMNAGFSTDISTNTDYYIIKPFLTRDVLKIDSKLTVQVLSPLTANLIVGASQEGVSAGSYSGYSRIMNWDTRSIDLVSDTVIPEFGINAIMDFFGTPIVQAGSKGGLYSYNGQRAERYKRIPGDWSRGKEGIIKSRAIASYLGIPVFGMTSVSDNPCTQGIYTLGGYDAKYPSVFSLEYVSGQSSNTAIGALEVIGEDLIFASKQSSSSLSYKVDLSNKTDTAFIETMIFNAAREKLKNFKMTVCYREMPSGSSLELFKKANDESSYQVVASRTYADRKTVETDVQVMNAANVQFKVLFNRATDTNEAPEIESIIIDFDTEK